MTPRGAEASASEEVDVFTREATAHNPLHQHCFLPFVLQTTSKNSTDTPRSKHNEAFMFDSKAHLSAYIWISYIW